MYNMRIQLIILAVVVFLLSACGGDDAPTTVPQEPTATVSINQGGSFDVGPIVMGNQYARIFVGETEVQSRSDINLVITVYLNSDLVATHATVTIDSVFTEDPQEWFNLAQQDNSIITIEVPQYSPLISGEIDLSDGRTIVVPETGLQQGGNTFSGGMFEVFRYNSPNPFFEMEPRRA